MLSENPHRVPPKILDVFFVPLIVILSYLCSWTVLIWTRKQFRGPLLEQTVRLGRHGSLQRADCHEKIWADKSENKHYPICKQQGRHDTHPKHKWSWINMGGTPGFYWTGTLNVSATKVRKSLEVNPIFKHLRGKPYACPPILERTPQRACYADGYKRQSEIRISLMTYVFCSHFAWFPLADER